jgi:hypothetical protein
VQREFPEVVAPFNQDIEGAELHLVIVQPAMERIEIGDAVDAKHHRLAVEHEALLADHPSSLDDPRVSASPVVTVAGEQAHEITDPLYAEPVAVVFTSWSHSAPAGTALPVVGRQNSKPGIGRR